MTPTRRYNAYGEVARVETPFGGARESAGFMIASLDNAKNQAGSFQLFLIFFRNRGRGAGAAGDFLMQPGSGIGPVAIRGGGRDAESKRCFVDRLAIRKSDM